jgi:tetratricopeptide (TPR) repeat protein
MAPDPRALKAFEVGKALFAEGRYVEAERKLVFAKDAGVEGAPELLAKTRAFLAKPVDPKARPPHRAEPLRHAPPLDPKEEAQHAYSEGKGFLKAENWARAVVSYQRAVAADPDLREAQFDLAVCLRKAGALGAALVEFQRFEAKWPTDGRRGIAEYNIKEINLQLTQSAP